MVMARQHGSHKGIPDHHVAVLTDMVTGHASNIFSKKKLFCRAFITETLIPPKDEDDTEENTDKSDFRDFVSNWLDKIRGNSSEMEKVSQHCTQLVVCSVDVSTLLLAHTSPDTCPESSL